MITILVAAALLVAGGLGAWLASARPVVAGRIGLAAAAAGCALGTAGAAGAWARGGALRLAWSVPYGELHLRADGLASLFLILIFPVGLLASLYGTAYWKEHLAPSRAGAAWLFHNLLLAGMVLVVVAANGILFLLAWEVMSLASFFLIAVGDDRDPAVRDAGRLYLVATHAGTAFLLVMFALLASGSGTMDFPAWERAGGPAAGAAGFLFLCALIGFGTKAGLAPFHVWLPEAHPAAPSHVSALMSAVMIETGLYGLLRSLGFLGEPPLWWGAALLGVGIASGILGAYFALLQPDIKRALAYSSVENAGITAAGAGLGLAGLSLDQPAMAALGFGGALLHVVHHALLKALLFMGAGCVALATGTRRIDRLGGLARRLPAEGRLFLVASAALSGLPPLNAFAGELLLYLSALSGLLALDGPAALLPAAAVAGLAMTGGLAAACFARLAGIVWLGEPRTPEAAGASGTPAGLRRPMTVLAAGALILAVLPAAGLALAAPAAAVCLAAPPGSSPAWEAGRAPMMWLSAGAVLTALLAAAVWRLRERRPARGASRTGPTWDCGYDLPSPRMQYTASSFSSPLASLFTWIPSGRVRGEAPAGPFPVSASYDVEIARPFQERIYRPAFASVARGLARLRWLQHGRVQLYVLYIVVTLIVLIVRLLVAGETP
ncbi:MAG TPA: proton-conducting transporter membrane subunit [Candidatus Polarisedimenticolia bacterium]|nr:proton-conducting transporter membrane subunit [Candidatus Polarisedimenticolia bacterium]